jgi:hypothetical protein
MASSRGTRLLLASAAVTAVVGVALTATPQAANALPGDSAASAVRPATGGNSAVSVLATTCYVTGNNVYYRASPNGTRLGQVHRGQGFDVTDWSDGWYGGTLWGGGPRKVWIHGSNLGSPCDTP